MTGLTILLIDGVWIWGLGIRKSFECLIGYPSRILDDRSAEADVDYACPAQVLSKEKE